MKNAKNEPMNQDAGEERELSSVLDAISRRGAVQIGVTAGLAAMIDSMLSGCKVRAYNAAPKTTPAAGDDYTNSPFPQYLVDDRSFLETWNHIGAKPENYPDPFLMMKDNPLPAVLGRLNFDLEDSAFNGDERLVRIAALRTLLMVFRMRVSPLQTQAELVKAGIDVVYPGGTGACMVLSHELVTGTVLNPETQTSDGHLLYTLGAYRPSMSDLTRHYILCDDLVARHDAEKAYQHEVAVKPSDAGLVTAICAKAADDLVAAALPGGTGTLDVVHQLGRWIPMKVVNGYFGVPCGPDAPKVTLSGKAAELFKGVADESSGKPVLQVSEELMYKWIANGFRNLFLNLGKDAAIAEMGNLSGAQLMYYIYWNVLEAEKNPTRKLYKDTMLGRLAQVMRDPKHKTKANPENPIVKVANSAARYLSAYQPLPELEQNGKPNPLAGLLTDLAAYRTSAQIAGSVAGAGVTIEEAIARVFEVLLRKGNEAHLAQVIAICNDPNKQTFAKYYPELFRYCNEALRFSPQAELLPRIVSPQGKGSLRAKSALVAGGSAPQAATVEVPGTTLVFTGIYAAMHDTKVVTVPAPADQFAVGRPPEHYLHFGWSHPGNTDQVPGSTTAHKQGNACLGRFIAPVEIVEAMRAVFKRVDGKNATKAELVPLPNDDVDPRPIKFQKGLPLPVAPDANFKLAEYIFNKADTDPKQVAAGESPFPASLRVVIS